MSRARSFTRSEIMDAAKAAAENGLCARLTPDGGIEFTPEPRKRHTQKPTPEELLEGFLNGRQVGGRA